MGSPCELQLYAKDKAQFEHVAQNVVKDLVRLEGKYSRYRADSFLSKINHCAAQGKSIEVDAETAHLLNYAQTCYEQSDGLFDITSGALRRVWIFNKDKPTLPKQKDIEAVLALVGWDKIVWDGAVLHFLLAGMEVDFGGIVKEYAADRVAALCSSMSISNGIVNLGGDIKIIGPHVDSSPWHIGIRDPKDKNFVSSVVQLHSGAMASSGDYERCIDIDGKRYGHILNPKTGWPVQHFASITVISDFCVLAGSASTIAMLKEKEGIAWLNLLGLAHQWIDIDGRRGGNII
jgi:thiamine biosynthesis lipoprotein